jgi:hypothetical protein
MVNPSLTLICKRLCTLLLPHQLSQGILKNVVSSINKSGTADSPLKQMSHCQTQSTRQEDLNLHLNETEPQAIETIERIEMDKTK